MAREAIDLPDSIEYLLTLLYGKHSYHGFVGSHTFAEWKKELTKIFRSIRESVVVNIDTGDQLHKRNLLDLCDNAVSRLSAAESMDEAHVTCIEILTKLVFSLLGGMPNHWRKHVVNRLEDWKLDEHRKLLYAQTPLQKAELLISLTERSEFSERLPSAQELMRRLRFEFKGDYELFLGWAKKQFPEICAEVL